jgi:hypothetical protein
LNCAAVRVVAGIGDAGFRLGSNRARLWRTLRLANRAGGHRPRLQLSSRLLIRLMYVSVQLPITI